MDVETLNAIHKVKEEIIAEVHKVELRVSSIETELKRYNTVCEVAYKAKEMAEDHEKAIEKLESNQKWGITSLIGLLVKIWYDFTYGR